jgi:hypothetical protein
VRYFMSGTSDPDPSATFVRVSDAGNQKKIVSGVTVENTEVAMRVTDCGRTALPAQSFKALPITTTAGTLASFNTDNNDLTCTRGIQLKASTGNTAIITVGGSDVVASATVANINGIPLAAGDTIFLEITHLSSLYAVAASGTQYLHWIAY